MNDLMIVSQNSVMPVMDMEAAKYRRNQLVNFVNSLMVEGVHYGKVPGTSKNTLYKAGSEMLSTFFGLVPMFEPVEVVQDWTGAGYDGEPFFFYRYSCKLMRNGTEVGQAFGSCNSWEKKYRYRNAGKSCPSCGAESIARSNYPPRGAAPGTPNGWYCRDCKSQFAHNDTRIAEQDSGKVKNDNPADIVNTIDKMAQKRALVAAILIAVNASEFFTQDLEDMMIDVDFEPVQKPASQKPAPTQKPTRPAAAQAIQPKAAPPPPPPPDDDPYVGFQMDGSPFPEWLPEDLIPTYAESVDYLLGMESCTVLAICSQAQRLLPQEYPHPNRGLNALKLDEAAHLWEGAPDGFAVTATAKITNGNRVKLLNWLLERKLKGGEDEKAL